MFKVIEKHPIVTAVVVLGGIYAYMTYKTAQAALNKIVPIPGPSQGGGGTDFQDVLVLQPGSIQEQMPAGGEIDLQLPLGAAWDTGNPVSQSPGSNIGATVDPLIPLGAEQQVWRGVKGNGTIVANWIDDKGNPQSTQIAVSTS